MTGPVLVVRNWLGYAVLITDSAVDATVAARHHAGATITAAPAADSVEYRVGAGRPDYSERAITLAESDMRDHESF